MTLNPISPILAIGNRHGRVEALGALSDWLHAYVEGRERITIEERATVVDVQRELLRRLKEEGK